MFFTSLGILSEVYLKGRAVTTIEVLVYLSMGWVCAFDLTGLKVALRDTGFFWVLLGEIVIHRRIIFLLS